MDGNGEVLTILLSAVVVYHSNERALTATMASLTSQCDEVLVVDVSVAQSAPAVVDDSKVRVLPAAANRGYGWACNLGIAAASGDVILVSNSDITFEPGAVRALAEVVANVSGIAAPLQFPHEIGAVRNATESLQLGISLRDALDRWLGLGRRATTARKAAVLTDADRSQTVRVPDALTLSGAALAATRAAWEAVGGFDEAFFLYQEDADLTMRFRQAGLTAWLVGAAQAVHTGGTNSRGLDEFTGRVALGSEQIAWRKHGLRVPLLKVIQTVGLSMRFLRSLVFVDMVSARVWWRLATDAWRVNVTYPV